jgi:hypothetical protein
MSELPLSFWKALAHKFDRSFLIEWQIWQILHRILQEEPELMTLDEVHVFRFKSVTCLPSVAERCIVYPETFECVPKYHVKSIFALLRFLFSPCFKLQCDLLPIRDFKVTKLECENERFWS